MCKYPFEQTASITCIAFDNNIVCDYARCRMVSVYIYIYDLLVRKAHRGKQIGKALVERVFNDFSNQPIDVMSDVDSYYEKLGYHRAGSIFEVKEK